MANMTLTVWEDTGKLRFSKPLFLGQSYALTVSGLDSPTVVFADCDGMPVAESDEGDEGLTLDLGTSELLALFTRAGIHGSPGAISVHCWVADADGRIVAQSDVPVFYAPYINVNSQLTKIDVTGPRGLPGPPGDTGPAGRDGVIHTAQGFYWFEVTDEGELIVHAANGLDLYAKDADGNPDPNKPLFKLGDCESGTTDGHLYYVIYDDEDEPERMLDLGSVKGPKGDTGSYDIDSEPTFESSHLVLSGGVFTALTKKADLDNNGKVPSSQLPSFVDDVLEYASTSAFPATGEADKIYIAQDTNKTYRWGGSTYVEISESLALGETSSTAYRGDKGKANADAIAELQTQGYITIADGHIRAVIP